MIYKIKPYMWKVLRDGKVLFVAIFLALALAIPNIALAPPPPGPSPNLESRVTALEGAVATLQAQVEDLTGASLQTIVAVYILGADTSNPSVATAELGGSLIVSLLALVAPLLTALIIVLLLWLAIRWLRQISRKPHRS